MKTAIMCILGFSIITSTLNASYSSYYYKLKEFSDTLSKSTKDKKELPYSTPVKNNTLLKKKVFSFLGCDRVYHNPILDSCYSFKKKSAIAVAYHIDGNLVYKIDLEKRPSWKYNLAIPKKYRSENSDYSYNIYDKGHLCFDSMADYNKRVLGYTYDLNINSVPMVEKVNRVTWRKAESRAKKIAYKYGYANIIDIMDFTKHPQKMGRNNISIARGFYKIINNKDAGIKECYYYKNDKHINTNNDTLNDHKIMCPTF